MIKSQFFLGCAVFIVSVLAHAELEKDCPTYKNLNPQFPELEEVQTAKNCYAIVVADLLSVATGSRASVVTVENEAERTKDDDEAKRRARRYGSANAYYRFQAFGQTMASALDASLNSKICRRSLLDTFKDDDLAKLFIKFEDLRTKKSPLLLSSIKSSFDRLSPGFAERLSSLSKQNLPMIDLAVDLSCNNIAPARKLERTFTDLLKKDFSLVPNELDPALSAGHPVLVGYDINILFSPEYFDRRSNDGHASTIVGQQWNRKKSHCDYLLRPTDKDTCVLIAKTPTSNVLSCENNIIHIQKSEFIKAISDVTWIR